MIYILETGEYSDYSYHAVVEGPDNLDVDDATDDRPRLDYVWRCPTHGRFTEAQAELLVCPFCWRHLTRDDGTVTIAKYNGV